jgi:hypothetical protein
MVSNVYLNELLAPLCSSYGGCFSCDNIPTIGFEEEANFIVNLSKVDQPGTHFVALIIKKTCIYYFDSFGVECSNPDILLYMSSLSRDITYNSLKVQAEESKMCGFYCALIVLRNDVECNITADLPFHLAEDQLLSNDKLCVQYICQTIETLK